MQARANFFYKKSAKMPAKPFSLPFALSLFRFIYYFCTVIWRIMCFNLGKCGFLAVGLVAMLCVACSHVSTPRPYGYYRITPPDTAYMPFFAYSADLQHYPYNFALSKNAKVEPRTDAAERYWVNIYYPDLDATIHCSYKPVRSNLRELTEDALEFVYQNASHASSIPEREYNHPEAKVYGVLFNLEGNTASSCQFFVTDSTRHFFRASVYCNCPPNADSLAPVYEYLQRDVIRLVESFEWK